jgi:bifunctional UDP-N-acetylglucosamine pyrophosphorylase/glucosamine-1-phosphate N-acetyltransferase
MSLHVVILAAGLGTRMKSKRAKVLHRAGGRTLVEQVVRAAQALTPGERIVVVTGHQADRVEEILRPYGVRFARQTEQRGTGHAVACCRPLLEGKGGCVMVLYGDTPLLSSDTLRALLEAHQAGGSAATLITTTLPDPTGYGRILRSPEGFVQSIVEQKAATPEQLRIQEVNSGIYCFQSDLLWKYLARIQPNNPAGEYYLTDMAELLNVDGHRVAPFVVEDPSELLGINTRVELAHVDRLLRERKVQELMLSGVTVEKPETVTIDDGVTVGTDTVIGPFVQLLGETRIGEECVVGACSIIQNSKLADRVEVAPFTVVADSSIAEEAHIGPFARLRMNNEVGARARIGNFVELKKTKLGAGAKSQHLAYLGDSEIGARANIGAGTITCNYDGVSKHRTRIGADAFIGSNSTLVAPVEIGDNSYVGAGSVITDTVPEGALALGRGRQVVKEGWVARRKEASGAKQSS